MGEDANLGARAAGPQDRAETPAVGPRPHRIPPVAWVAVTLVVLAAGCSSSQPIRRYVVGPAGSQLSILASAGQTSSSLTSTTTLAFNPATTSATPGGPPAERSVLPGAHRYAYSLRLSGQEYVGVTVWVSPAPIPTALAAHLIDDFYNNIPAHLTTWHGLRADEGVIRCASPGGPCPGYQGALTVLINRTLYDVRLATPTRGEAQLVLDSVRINGAG